MQIANSNLNAKICYDRGVLTIFFNDSGSTVWERDCIFSKRKGLLPDCSISMKDREWRRSQQTEVRQRNLLARRKRKAWEQPEARRARLDTEHERIHECRAREQPEARQARLNRQRERDCDCRANRVSKCDGTREILWGGVGRIKYVPHATILE